MSTTLGSTTLRCRYCSTHYELAPVHACENCFGPLEISYDQQLFARLKREDITQGPKNIWRYLPFLPAGHNQLTRVDMGVGLTPLVTADRLASAIGLRRLWIKNDSANPTHSFKDRVVSVALTAALERGFTRVACASTGNLANSVAAHAAWVGIESIVFIPRDLEETKIVATAVYGGQVVAVDGSYDEVNRLCAELGETDEFAETAFVNMNLRPFYAEGSKTVGFEIAEQLGWRIPEQIIIPVASGSLLTKIDKAFRELVISGLVPDTPWRVYGIQSQGCSPVTVAFANGSDIVEPVKPTGIAKSLNIGNPADGVYALDVARRTSGAIVSVDDDEIREAIQLLASTQGIFTETAGGVTVAGLRKLHKSGLLDPEAETVVVNTGEGLKTIDALADIANAGCEIKPSLQSAKLAGLLR